MELRHGSHANIWAQVHHIIPASRLRSFFNLALSSRDENVVANFIVLLRDLAGFSRVAYGLDLPEDLCDFINDLNTAHVYEDWSELPKDRRTEMSIQYN